MIRAVLDANVFASGVLRYELAATAPALLLRAWYGGSFMALMSDPLRAEIHDTLLIKPYFVGRIPREVAERWLRRIDRKAESTAITITLSGVASHPEDDLILATAVSGSAGYLVTGDRQLQRLRSFQGVVIISPAEFLAELEALSD